ncbi:MAG TPA: SRPBCC family protein [Acidimicrobiales bacterium]|nr:SRPBCC family protein [Acidimicrobiales bacterium]
MSDQVTERMTTAAPPERVYEIVTDFDAYPVWAPDLKEVEVEQRDAEGRATHVRFRAAAFGRSINYTLEYSYAEAPARLSWVQTSADITSRIDGTYEFEPCDGGTTVTYHLEVDLKMPVPGFIKQRTAARIVGTALRHLRARAEATSATP